MTPRHIAYFDQRSGVCLREWLGELPEPDIDPTLVGDGRLAAMNTFQQSVAPALVNEIGLDVTHIGWPVGDFCYCVFDPVTRFLDWGPERFYIELATATLEVTANQRSHRPIRESHAGHHVFDITGTPWERFHGQIFGRFVRHERGWAFLPSSNQVMMSVRARQALAEAPIDILAAQFATRVPVGQQVT